MLLIALLYLWTATPDDARSICALFGDVDKEEARSTERYTVERRVVGCYLYPGTISPEAVIVCTTNDEVCRLHEERHHHEGHWHP